MKRRILAILAAMSVLTSVSCTACGNAGKGVEQNTAPHVAGSAAVSETDKTVISAELIGVCGRFDFADGTYTAAVADSLAVNTTDAFDRGTVEVTVEAAANSDNGIVVGLTGRGENYWEGDGISYYFFFIGRDGTAYLGKTDDGRWTALKVIADESLTSETPHVLKVVLDGTDLRCYVDGKLYIIFSERRFLKGIGYGLRAGGAMTKFGNFSVTRECRDE